MLPDSDTISFQRTGPLMDAMGPVVIPRILGPVRLLDEIGRGGMGVVYRAWHELLARDVAVKFLIEAAAGLDDSGHKRFLEGAQAAAAIRHPGLTTIHHADLADRVPYLVMDYVEGPSLGEVLERAGRLPIDVAWFVMQEAVNAVAALHERDVIHRDIKPANILVNSSAQLFVTDFGLACNRQVDGRLAPAGTPAYMAPEMFDGTVTPRSDVYAIGICLFELLAGMKPFRGSMNEIAVLHKTQPLPLNTLERTGVSPGLLEIIERATNKNPIYRFKSAAQMARAMRETAPSGFNAELARTRLGTLLTTSDNNETATQLEGDFSTSYFERISALADQRSDARTPEFPPELNENETSNSSTIARPQRRLFREPLQLKACPRCEYDLAGLPRRHQCPECGFPYDENMFTVHAWYRERLSMPGRLAFARSWVSKAYYALLILFFPVLILSSIVIRSWQSKNWQGSILSAVFWGGLIVLGVTRAFFYSRTRRKKKGTLQVLFTSEGVAERRKGELSRCMRWENFRYFRFRRKGKNLWRLRLCGRFWGRFIHAGVLRRWLKNPGFWVELEASPRVAAFVRSEIRRRLPHGVSPRRNRKTKVVNPSLEPVKGGG